MSAYGTKRSYADLPFRSALGGIAEVGLMLLQIR
jgi:hypothetical protein